ncbi:serine hydrolase domain-containing protein [Roseococcus sp. DSY-14]|uniref:serine hydrolase domain-containing protein n=1 Tax=Roseococcus sp. DSY-14 TaxID=3369650 RepID=UPI00387B4B4B
MRDLDLLRLERRVGLMLAPLAGGPGAAVGVARDGALLLRRGGGLASLEHQVPIGPDTAFRIASVSKHVTCAALLLLEREGRLRLDDPLGKHLPALPAAFHPLPLRLLAQNRAGLRDMFELARLGGLDLSHPVSEAELDGLIAPATGLNFAPGTRFLYSNTGFRWLGQAIEAVEGAPLAEVLDRRIFAPLGMTRTRHAPDLLAPVPGLATGHLADGRRAPHGFPLGGEGGLVSTVEDLALWARALSLETLGPLEAALAEAPPFPGGAPGRYGLGLEVGEWRGLRLHAHGGLWPGYRSAFLRVPSRRLTVMVLANSAGLDPLAMALEVLAAALAGDAGLRPAPPAPPADGLEGRWACLEAGLSLDIGPGPVARMHGTPFALVPHEDGRWHERRAAFPFALRQEDGALAVEMDAGVTLRFDRAPGGKLPALDGTWRCAEAQAEWRIAGEHVEIGGPLRRGVPGRLEAVAPGLARVHAPSILGEMWWDVRVEGARLTVNAGRARGMEFSPSGRTASASPRRRSSPA